jgi:hypothetical protein
MFAAQQHGQYYHRRHHGRRGRGQQLNVVQQGDLSFQILINFNKALQRHNIKTNDSVLCLHLLVVFMINLHDFHASQNLMT